MTKKSKLKNAVAMTFAALLFTCNGYADLEIKYMPVANAVCFQDSGRVTCQPATGYDTSKLLPYTWTPSEYLDPSYNITCNYGHMLNDFVPIMGPDTTTSARERWVMQVVSISDMTYQNCIDKLTMLNQVKKQMGVPAEPLPNQTKARKEAIEGMLSKLNLPVPTNIDS